MSLTIQRLTGVLVLVLAGMVSLPVSAYFLDGQGTENWIVPVQLLGMAVVGALVTVGLPALAMQGAATWQRALIGVGWGIAGAGLGVIIFWALISGVSGA